MFANIHILKICLNIMNFPEVLKYTPEHEWLRLEEGSEFAYVGITDFAQGELGDIIYVDVDCLGESFEANAVFGGIEAVKTVSDLFLPVSGTIVEINPLLDKEPSLVNTDPYEQGWIVKVKLTQVSELEHLMDATTYKTHIGKA